MSPLAASKVLSNALD